MFLCYNHAFYGNLLDSHLGREMKKHRDGRQTDSTHTGQAGVSLARVLSKMGIASRTVAATLIEAGRVSVNGQVLRNPDVRINMARDRVALDNTTLSEVPKRYIAVNKPRGLVTTVRDEQGRETVYTCLGEDDRHTWLAPVGRLDKASEGLIFFTNDTAWAQRILDPARHLPKTYHVQVNRLLNDDDVAKLQQGVILAAAPAHPCARRTRASCPADDGVFARAVQVQVLRSGQKNCWLEVVLQQGINRQIRRMLAVLDADVLRLIRVAIGPVMLGTLPRGQSRPLTEDELRNF